MTHWETQKIREGFQDHIQTVRTRGVSIKHGEDLMSHGLVHCLQVKIPKKTMFLNSCQPDIYVHLYYIVSERA